ncbi:MAG: fibrinogen-like YCDxxxxGGGW domain-containing protein, partial [bacterium]
SNDGCSATCVHERICGDGVMEGTEECDDGNNEPGDGCSPGCFLTYTCGDGVCETDKHETCPACPEDCCPCGDGVCDQAMAETCALCHEDCCPDCGDGWLDASEQCDDGNNVDGDGCSAACIDEDGSPTCGNGIWEAGEQCDDGNTTNLDGCSDTCQVEYECGDGVCETTRGESCPVCPQDCCPCGDAVCDDALGETCGMCRDDCCPDCGNGILDAGEECDDGNLTDNDGCDHVCEDEDGVAVCGNGLWEAGEGCDDGNTTPGDGCDGSCGIEFVCGDAACDTANGETCQLCPGDCCPNCGNGVLEAQYQEECDTASFGTASCADYCYPAGSLSCTAYCTIDVSTCTGSLPVCGNATVDGCEDCDGANLNGQDCTNLGYDGGTLACDPSTCLFDFSSCGDPFQSCDEILTMSPGAPDGVYTIDADGPGGVAPFQVWCDMTTDGGGWTMIAVLSNADAKNWAMVNPWWYTTTAAGDHTNPATTADAVSPAYYTVVASEFMIMDSDSGTSFRRSTGNCLGNDTFGGMIASLSYTPGTSGLYACAAQCDLQGTGTLSSNYYSMLSVERARFGCNDSTDTAGMITLYTDTSYYYDTMANCNEADYGLGSLESPPWGATASNGDVGYGGSTVTTVVRLYVR